MGRQWNASNKVFLLTKFSSFIDEERNNDLVYLFFVLFVCF